MAADTPGTKTTVDDYVLPGIKKSNQECMMPLELEAYRDWREGLFDWAKRRGKEPWDKEGYSPTDLKDRMFKVDNFAVWVFETRTFTTVFLPEHAEAYWYDVLKPKDIKRDSKRKCANAVQMALRYEHREEGGEKEGEDVWKIPNSVKFYQKIDNRGTGKFTDWLRPDELEKVKAASLRAYAVPNRDQMTEDEEEEWAAHLAQRFRKPRDDLDEEDWSAANSYKIPSIVYVARDLGLRPSEVGRARTYWPDLDNNAMRIELEDSTKNYWDGACNISEDAARILERWMDEREEIGMYDNTDRLWLTREGNPYSSGSLGYVMRRLMEEAGIDTTNRETAWYMMRRGVGTEVANTPGCGLSEVKDQLRIRRTETANRYVQTADAGTKHYLETR